MQILLKLELDLERLQQTGVITIKCAVLPQWMDNVAKGFGGGADFVMLGEC